VDLRQLQEAGLYDPAAEDADARLELLEFLESEGCTVEEMQLAHERGRLFALAGDRRIRPIVGLLSMREAGTRLETDPHKLAHVWQTFGLTVQDTETPALTEGDVEALQTYLELEALLGEDMAHAFARVVGAAMARVTEAVAASMRTGVETVSVYRTGSEVVTAKAYSEITKLVPRVGSALDSLHRQHLEATRQHFEGIDSEGTDGVSFRCGVGFADLSGFTSMSQQLPIGQLSRVLNLFEETATHTVHEHHGRIVKFLGDAVMWVSAQPGDLVAIAHALVTHPAAVESGIQVRAGIAYGAVLAQDGDYFGPPVNLASRLVASAEPGQVLASEQVVELVDPSCFEVQEPLVLRGYDEPVAPYELVLPPDHEHRELHHH
jgi:class 3 adenylate cyclase